MATHEKRYTKNKNHTGSNKALQHRDESLEEEYATIGNPKGGAQFECTIFSTNVSTIATARGCLCSGPKKKRINRGDLVLIQKDECTTTKNKYYIIHVYSADDIKQLRKAGELAQIKEEDDDQKVAIVFEGDVVIQQKPDIVEIDDDFISEL